MNEEEIKLIDGFFNKGWCCDLDEVYNTVMKLQDLYNKERERNKNLEHKEVMLKEKLERDIEDDNCMWVDNKEKIVKTAKTIIDRSNYAKEILELLEEGER